jgi:hypothetical protein
MVFSIPMTALTIVLAALAVASPEMSATETDLLKSMPPAQRGKDEIVAPGITDKAVKRCIASQRRVVRKLKWRIVRTQKTASAAIGQIWRADVATVDRPPIVTRLVCTRAGGLSHPLEMFDPTESIPPLY